ncbi:MAG: sigma 54 modulation/S30EA ribosomal C-terminal domain-containing protein [Bryobacteraceae bacterium]
MNLHYTGKLEKLDPPSEKKLNARIAKLGKLLDKRTEKEAHVILKQERHNRLAEITLNYYDHPLAAQHSAADSLAALLGACDKMEKQIIKLQEKFRDGKRRGGKPAAAAAAAPVAEAAEVRKNGQPRIYRVNPKSIRKPMTVDEAVLELDAKRAYVLYRDSRTDRIAILVRRLDGHLDLIEV